MTHAQRPFDHVLIIMFENQYRGYVMRNEYFRGLARQGIDLCNFHGVMHPSQTNYIASIAGELCNVSDDERPSPLPQRTIVDLIEESPLGLEWRAYMQSYIPQNHTWSADMVPQDQYPYVIKHNPFSSFQSIIERRERWEKIVDESAFWSDLQNRRLPNYAWFTPNMWNDGHYLEGTKQEPEARAPALVDQAARWLRAFFGALRFPGPHSHLPSRTLVVVTFDEADYEAAFDVGRKYTYDGPNQVYTVLLGDEVDPAVYAEGYNHYSLLKTVEKNFNLEDLGKNDRHASWMRFLWGERFAWGGPESTPITGARALTVASLHGTLFCFYIDADGRLWSRQWSGARWSGARAVPLSARGLLAAASTGCALLLAYTDVEGVLKVSRYDLDGGYADVSGALGICRPVALSVAAIAEGQALLCYADDRGMLHSRIFSEPGAGEPSGCAAGWDASAQDVGFATEEGMTLGALGGNALLIHHPAGDQASNELSVLSYNTQQYNTVVVPPSKYGGAYDDTSCHQWSRSRFGVAQFAAASSSITPDEPEPKGRAVRAGPRLCCAVLDGVLHLITTGPDNALLKSVTFSLPGVMTAVKPVSESAKDETTTSNGYGTMAEVGWGPTDTIDGAWLGERGVLSATECDGELCLLFAREDGDVQLVRGAYRWSPRS